MIIDTDLISSKELRILTNLMLESNLCPDENIVFNAKCENSDNYVNAYDVVEYGKIVYKFGIGGNIFELQNSRHSKIDLISLKNLPISCEYFYINNFDIKIIDYLPKAKNYSFNRSIIYNIIYPFPKTINTLTITNSKIKNFDFFPTLIECSLVLEKCDFTNSNKFPVVNNTITLERCNKLKTLNLKGSYKSLTITQCAKIESIKNLNTNIEVLSITECNTLKYLDLSKINEKCEVYISYCENLDPYTILQSNPIITCTDFDGNFLLYYLPFYDNTGIDIVRHNDPRGLSIEEFEIEVLNYWVDKQDIKRINNIKLYSTVSIEMRINILKSFNGISKFKL